MTPASFIGRDRPKRKKKKGARCRRKLLKRLVPEKGIQEKQSLFLGQIWLRVWLACLGFEKFGVGLKGRFGGLVQTRLAAGYESNKTNDIGVAEAQLNSQIHARSAPSLLRAVRVS